MQIYDEANTLASHIRECEESRTYRALKEEVQGNETLSALLKEYKRLQIKVQLSAVSGGSAETEEIQRFQQIGNLLFADATAQRYLLAEMRMQQMMADVFKILNNASGLEMPGM